MSPETTVQERLNIAHRHSLGLVAQYPDSWLVDKGRKGPAADSEDPGDEQAWSFASRAGSKKCHKEAGPGTKAWPELHADLDSAQVLTRTFSSNSP